MSVVDHATGLFEEATEAARDGQCRKARQVYRKGQRALRQALRITRSHEAPQMIDAQITAKVWLRRGCAFLGRRR